MLVLDAFNVLHTVGVLPPEIAGVDIPGLAELIIRSRFASEHTIFVCDGLPAPDMPRPGALDAGQPSPGRFDVRYSGTKSTADDEIRRIIDASTAPRRLTVVSSDHAIIRHARRRRCTALTSPEFLTILVADARVESPLKHSARKPSSISVEQVHQWIKVFNVDQRAIEQEVDAATRDQSPPSSITDAPTRVSTPPRSDTSPNQPAPQPLIEQPVLPANLIEEAESLLQSEQAVRQKRPDHQNNPTDLTDDRVAKPQQPTDGTGDELDMNSILPQDGRTYPLRKRSNRRGSDS